MDRKNTVPIPKPIMQLQRQLDEFRNTHAKRTKLQESLWQAAFELARQHGVYRIAHPLYNGTAPMQKTGQGVSDSRADFTIRSKAKE